MKNSSIIFVGGFTLVFGFYANQSFIADSDAIRVADIRAAQMQADLIAMTGCYLGTYYMATPTSSDGFSVSNRSVNGGRLSYTISYNPYTDPNRATIVSVGTVGTVTVTKRAEMVKGVTGRRRLFTWTQWSLNKVFTDPYNIANVTE